MCKKYNMLFNFIFSDKQYMDKLKLAISSGLKRSKAIFNSLETMCPPAAAILRASTDIIEDLFKPGDSSSEDPVVALSAQVHTLLNDKLFEKLKVCFLNKIYFQNQYMYHPLKILASFQILILW